MEQDKLRRKIIIEKAVGLICIIVGAICGVVLIVMNILTQFDIPGRALIAIPFAIMMGIASLRKVRALQGELNQLVKYADNKGGK